MGCTVQVEAALSHRPGRRRPRADGHDIGVLRADRSPYRDEHVRHVGPVMRFAAAFVAACVPLHAAADAKAGEQKAQLCLLCHREGPEFRFTPFLVGQSADYLVSAIMAFKTGQRKQPAMNANVANLTPADIRDIADYFASKPFQFSNENLEPAKIAAGEKLVGEMKCASCHGPSFGGAGTVPRLAGQKQPYLSWQLQSFRGGGRTHPPGMPVLADQADVESVASYLASLR
jgi:cytochrome c553